ncbi:Na(+)/H(+) antiporter subunit D [Hirschia baltica]|uniref:NADH/Ubiquinone/plastoquinone (Complex I) n=1 Tax=Hirschia baltica (strain ATCC 49814 / DSM 5838 / IFAM 1418) TaxID=582402 RepID=C6XI93_HIRBI|nr:Na(+)/H(+) antiporter subunit D [Hirschia baltica]ACT58919.1 NADH/Ubiquinone/plastoquinone (complex I) [Hirschia baltica ATCC 49814]
MSPEFLPSLVDINPGFAVILAGILAYFIRIPVLRAIITIGGPVIGLLMLSTFSEFGVDHGVMRVMDLTAITYRVDSLSFIFALAFLIAAAINSIYSLHNKDPLQDACALIYAGAAIAASLCGDLMTVFFFWELTAVSSVFLIWQTGTKAAYKAGMRYIAIQILSGVLLLFGAVYFLGNHGDLSLRAISLEEDGAWLIFLGFGIKAAFPFLHNWLQDSYPKATPTGAVVLSAFTTKLAVYMFARMFPGEHILIYIGAVMTIFPVFFAVVENDLRKVLAYSLNNQVGFMICAIGVANLDTEYGRYALNGAAAHAFAHIMYKGLLFMSMGAVLHRTGTTKASELGGLWRTMPWTTVFCLIGAASISAFPLFSGFVAKSMTLSAIGHEGYVIVWCMLLFASAGVLEHSGIKIPYFAFFGHDSGKRPKEAPFNMLVAMGCSAFICIAVGIPGLGGTKWLYSQLPYATEALYYLEHSLWTWDHVVTQFQLLILAMLAFVLMQRFGLYPAEKPGVVLDFDWTYRRIGYGFAHWADRLWERASPAMTNGWRKLGSRVHTYLTEAFSPEGMLSKGGPSGSMAVWTALILGLVIAVSVVSAI